MVFLILLIAAWAMAVVPKARDARWSRPTFSTKRYRSSMRLVAPLTESEIRRANAVAGTLARKRARRREIIVFLGSGTLFSGIAAVLSADALAWPICAAFSGLLLMYVGAISEVDRRKVQRRIAERRARRAAEALSEEEYAEAV